jgi:DNA-binding MarR family transcriptional regulator
MLEDAAEIAAKRQPSCHFGILTTKVSTREAAAADGLTGAHPTGWKAMASAGHRKGARPIVDSKGEAIADLMLEVAEFFFRIRAVGQKTGLITSWGGGTFGFMRSLALLGPLTVPQIAQMRPTSRQRMQRLADELAAEGLVEFVDNPKHRRSKLVQLTPKGDTRYRELNARFLVIASTLGVDLSEEDVRRTREIVRRLSDEVKRRSERPS